MDISILHLLLIVILAYAVVPTALLRLTHFGAISRAPKGGKRVILTFDDGPDPRYTPRILKILRHYQVKACFFITGTKARAYPELIQQIASAGHEIGNHGFRHKAAWLLGPRATTREIAETNRTLEELTGKTPLYCRPSWGLFNLCSLWYYWRKGLKIVLWTYMSWDWTKSATPESITRRVLNKIRDGVILILHDSDDAPGAAPGAPARVAAALPQILEEIKRRGWRVAPLEEIIKERKNRSGWKKAVLFVWRRFDWLIRQLAGIRDTGNGKASFWRLALRRYHGPGRLLPDGLPLQAGDYYLELHINNDYLLDLLGEYASIERITLTALREFRQSMPELALFIENHRQYDQARVLLGITLLHRNVKRFGFQVHHLRPGIGRTFTDWYEKLLLTLLHPGGLRSLKSYLDTLTPACVVISRDELRRRYLPADAPEIETPRNESAAGPMGREQ